MGCGNKCPYVPGLRRDDWPLPDPKGRPMDEVRAVRDDIKVRVAELVQAEGLGRKPAGLSPQPDRPPLNPLPSFACPIWSPPTPLPAAAPRIRYRHILASR